MLFRKKIDHLCSYCAHGTQLENDKVLCPKKGVVSVFGKCRKFVYDPCKRIPSRPKALDFEKYNEEDYGL